MPKFQPFNSKDDERQPKETPIPEKDRIELSKLQADADIKKSEASMVIAENNLKMKLAEANIKSLEDFTAQRDNYNNLFLEYTKSKSATDAQQTILNDLIARYDTLLVTTQSVMAHQEQITTEANEKLAQADSKLAHYTELQERKCAECLQRDKRKCEKCNYKIFCETVKRGDYAKWLKGSRG